MAKQIEGFEIIIRGAAKSGEPTQMFAQYRVKDGELRSDLKVKDITAAAKGKTLFGTGASGEFFYDVFAGVEADEGV